MTIKPWLDDGDLQLYLGDCREVLRALPAESVHCVVTSPPYWNLRDYWVEGQLGLEASPLEYVARMVEVFREVHRVLRPDGTCWLNLGDTYVGSGKGAGGSSKQKSNHGANILSKARTVAGLKAKNLAGVPWRVALALQDEGWVLRDDIIWNKLNAMPESVTDRPTRSHEYIFMLSKSPSYFYDQLAVMEPAEWARWGDQTNAKHQGSESAASWIEPKTKEQLQARGRQLNQNRGDQGAGGFYKTDEDGQGWRNMRDVWSMPTETYTGSHFACFPQELPRRCILAGCPEGGTVLDPFAGSGTTGFVARALGRRSVLVELSEEYARLIAERTQQLSLLT